MIKHIVMWKMKDEALGMKREALALAAKAKLEGLVGVVPQIKVFQLGINVVESATAHDLVLVSEFESLESLKGYIDHPAHQEVVKFMLQVIAERRAVDFEAA